MQFQEIYDRNHQQVEGYFNRLLTPADADDAVQEFWLKMVERAKSGFSSPDHATAICFKIASQVHLGIIRDKSRSRKRYDPSAFVGEIIGETGVQSNVEQAEAAPIKINLTQRLVDMLNPRLKQVVELKLAGVSFKEISVQLGVPIGACRARYERAIVELKSRVQDHHADEYLKAV